MWLKLEKWGGIEKNSFFILFFCEGFLCVHVHFALYSLVLEVGVKGPNEMPQKIS